MKLAIILALSALMLQPVRAAPPTPLLWQVSDGDNTVYLLGSFHFLMPHDYPLAASVGDAFDDAETVYFEISPDQMNDPNQAQQMFKTGLLPAGTTLHGTVGGDVWSELVRYCSANGIPVDTFNAYKPWLAALLISIAEMQKYGLEGDLGLDRYFMDRAQKAGKAIVGLETLDEQFALFATLTAKEQEQFLSETLKQAGNTEYVKRLHSLWRGGDADGLWRAASREMIDNAPGFYRSFVVDRNNAWVGKIAAFIRDRSGDDALVVVGSMHLLGGDGLVEVLKRQGFRVQRLH